MFRSRLHLFSRQIVKVQWRSQTFAMGEARPPEGPPNFSRLPQISIFFSDFGHLRCGLYQAPRHPTGGTRWEGAKGGGACPNAPPYMPLARGRRRRDGSTGICIGRSSVHTYVPKQCKRYHFDMCCCFKSFDRYFEKDEYIYYILCICIHSHIKTRIFDQLDYCLGRLALGPRELKLRLFFRTGGSVNLHL